MNFRVTNINNHKEWNKVLSKVDCFDFYHTPSYQQLDESGEPRLLVFEDGVDIMAIPLLFRRIPGSDFYDVTSVYGYAGWIRNTKKHHPEVFPILDAYFKEEKVISAFSRLHPLVDGSDWFDRGDVIDSNITVAIDLKTPETMQWSSYSESVRRIIKRSYKSGMTIRMIESDEDIVRFADLYREAMALSNASPSYFFPDQYFFALLRSSEFRSFILFAEVEGQLAGGGLFTECNQFMQYHLGAMSQSYKSLSPLKGIIDEARLIANQQKLSLFHLGGGYRGKNDGLYTFKSRMATLHFTFKIWKWIVDEDIYALLSAGKDKSADFPLYRN